MTSVKSDPKQPSMFVKCLLCGRQVKVFLSKSNRPFYSCFTKDGGCGCQFYIREEPALQLFTKKVNEIMGTFEVPIPATISKPDEKAILEQEIKKPEDSKEARLSNEEAKDLPRSESGNCPRCGKPVNWDNLTPKKITKPGYFDLVFGPDQISVKECPLCGYVEEINEET